ncbi:KTSC domain-containing protein [Nakamurella flavida]|uniref:KTSC domain-containing protein n=1 Tax=Nakamurella flavida TaxID=363630 RepID=A0A938YP81_9ACTN|nr:KTSC domain-containing protein [Nakamurella flavida]MBM9478181.1 KTSC domain-containing protein [Nakamurella flavida]MDP9778597.1 hypothetical protein [Nakamurella flavida]
MRRIPVSSNALRSVGFDPATNELELEFTEGGIYRYSVPARVHRELMAADSLGRYFLRSIRPRYPSWEVHD